MKKTVKQKWVNALRSGKYKKAKNSLRTKKGYCCLGVLCDLYAKEKGDKWEKAGFVFNFHDKSGVLSEKVRKWAGLKSTNPTVKFGKPTQNTNLSNVNDETSTSFNKIADIIDKQL